MKRRKNRNKNFFWILTLLWFVTGVFWASAAPLSEVEKKQLESDLEKVEKQIAETESIIGNYKQQGVNLKSEINRLNGEITKANLQIKAINIIINRLDNEIGDNRNQVVDTEEKLDAQKAGLQKSLQNIYEHDGETIVEIVLKSPTLSYFFANVNGLLAVQTGLKKSLEQTVVLRDKLIDQREELALRRSDQENLRLYQTSQRQSLQGLKKEKDNLLAVTKGEEARYQDLLKESRKTAAQIRGRIFEFLGGGQMTFEQAYKLAKSAGDLTGIRPAIILAVLDRESALGANVGKCNYKNAMHPTRDLPKFLQIVQQLGINPDSVSVSCPISYDGAFGGALGPAQFLASTWLLFSDQIASLTGSHPPSPWNNFDSIVGTALYFKEARNSSACVNYSQEIPSQAQLLLDRCAAARYYAGGNWYRHRWTYGEAVVRKAAQFEDDIANITS